MFYLALRGIVCNRGGLAVSRKDKEILRGVLEAIDPEGGEFK